MKTKRQASDSCHYCQAPQQCFGAEIALDDKNPLVQETVLLKKGEILYHQQEKIQGIYLLKSGAIKTYWLNEQGRQTMGSFYLPGELLGFSSVSSHTYVENAQALRDTEVCRIAMPLLLNRVSKEPAYQTLLVNLMSASLARVEKARYAYIDTSATQKVAIFLVDYSQRLSKSLIDAASVNLLPTQQDMASYLGLTAETVSRTMTQFQRQGLVQFSQAKQMLKLDYAKLQTLMVNACSER